MITIQNPILRGFHPDPCICRKGDDFYIATSTFEWFPGVSIHHSKDLMSWTFLGGVLDRVSQLDLKGCERSCGVWAPDLSWADGKFWLVYTNQRHWKTPQFEGTNYLVTAERIDGPWSEPVALTSSGFDPSLFHAPDGKKYVLNMRGGRCGYGHFNGIEMQELEVKTGKLIGEAKLLWEGTKLGLTEGPHLLFKDGYYYLITAEGGRV